MQGAGHWSECPAERKGSQVSRDSAPGANRLGPQVANLLTLQVINMSMAKGYLCSEFAPPKGIHVTRRRLLYRLLLKVHWCTVLTCEFCI
jgi:hypothetical protein